MRTPRHLVVRDPESAWDRLAILPPALRPANVEDGDWFAAAESLGQRHGVHDVKPARLKDCHCLAPFRSYASPDMGPGPVPLLKIGHSPPNGRHHLRTKPAR